MFDRLTYLVGSSARLWLYQLARGFDSESVADRHLPKSIGCSKNFRGPEVLRTRQKVRHWLVQLANEASERLTLDQQVVSSGRPALYRWGLVGAAGLW